MKNPKGLGRGALIRGADGALYFIPQENLRGFRLDPKNTADAIKECDKLGVVEEETPQGDILPTLFGDDLASLEEGRGEFPFCVDVNMIKLPALARRRRK
jgi:hypothetical protein